MAHTFARSPTRNRTRALACTLVAGLALPCAARPGLNVTVDGNALTINGSSSSFAGVAFRAVRDDLKKTIAFYFKGDLKIAAPVPVRFTVQNADYPVRLIVGNDATFNFGLELIAGTAGAGAGGSPGSGGPISNGLGGDLAGNYISGGNGGVADCVGSHSNGDEGLPGTWSGAVGGGNPGVPGTAGSNGSLGVNQNPLNGGNGQGGTAGAGAPATPKLLGSGNVNGGSAGAYGFASGSNGGNGSNGIDGPDQNDSAPGGTGGDAINPFNPLKNAFSPILIAGNGGGAGAGAGGGAPGNGGAAGSSGGSGGGGGSTFCNDGGSGGTGGAGGAGRSGGDGGAGGDGQAGAAGGGALEFTALGKLIINGGSFNASGESASGSRIAGTVGQWGNIGVPGDYGSEGQVVHNPAGNGGNGGVGGWGGRSGGGGVGGSGGLGTGGSGGTVFLSATELTATASFNVLGGSNTAGLPVADSGRAIISYNHSFSGQLTADPAANNGPVLTLPGLAPEASQASPYISGGPIVPYIAGLEGGAAVAGVIPGLKATSLVNPATLPPHTLGAVLMLDTDVPGIKYDKNKYRALLFLNYSPSPDFQIFAMGIGAAGFNQACNTYGWANDTRFGSISGPMTINALGDAVYVTLVPVGQPNQNLARIAGFFRNAANTGVDGLIAESTTFGVGTSKILTVQRMACEGDFNSDGMVDDADFQIFVVGYNILDCADSSMPAGCPTDINRDGFVDDADFTKFVVAYNALVCP